MPDKLPPIHAAAAIGHNAEISRLASTGTDVNTYYAEAYYAEEYPLSIAFKKGHFSTVLLLLDLGANPRNPIGYHSFFRRFIEDSLTYNHNKINHTDALNILKKLNETGQYVHGAKLSGILSVRDFTSDFGGEEFLEFCLEQGANPDAKWEQSTYSGNIEIPLLKKYLNHPSILKLLRSYGADISILFRKRARTVREYIDELRNDIVERLHLKLDDPEATIKALTDPVELKIPRSSGMKEKIDFLVSRQKVATSEMTELLQINGSLKRSNAVKIDNLKAQLESEKTQSRAQLDGMRRKNEYLFFKIDDLKAQLESEKVSARSELARLESDMTTVTESLARAREEAKEYNRAIDVLRRAKNELKLSTTEKIGRLEAQVLRSGQALQTCESEKASTRSQLSLVTDTMSAASESLAQSREISQGKIEHLESQLLARGQSLKTCESERTSMHSRLTGLEGDIERLQSQLLECGQSLETCGSEKNSAHSELEFCRVKIATISESARVQSKTLGSTIDGLRQDKTSLERTSKAAIERLESQLLVCGQSLETCGSDKASAYAQMTRLEGEIATISESSRVQSVDLSRTIDDLRQAKTDLEQTSKGAVERLESQLLACGQSLETCESEKASMRSQLSSLEGEMATISTEHNEHNRENDALRQAKNDLEQKIVLLRAAVDGGLLTTDSLRAEIVKLKRDTGLLKESCYKGYGTFD